MKNSKTLVSALAFLILILGACKDNGDDAPEIKPSENPMATILQDATWTQKTSTATWELGFIFSTSADGKITQLGCKMPEPGTYTVSLWDQSTKTLLRQKTVEQSSPDKFVSADIDELLLTKDKKYAVSVNTFIGGSAKKYYYVTNSNSNIFPIVRGSILIQSSAYKSSATPKYPDDGGALGSLYGYPDFTFIPN